MPDDPRHRGFHLEINSVEEFTAFVAVIRNEDLAGIRRLIDSLGASTDALRAAESAASTQQQQPLNTKG